MQKEDLIEKNFRLNENQKKALKKLGLITLRDLFYHFPTRYGDTSTVHHINTLEKGLPAVIFGKISGLKTSKAFIKKIPMAEAFIEDETGKIKAIWFNQPYLAKMIAEESFVRIEGKVSERKGELYFSNPKVEMVSKVPFGVGNSLFGEKGEGQILYPIYPESRGITSNWMYHAIQKMFSARILDQLIDPIPETILKKYNLPSLGTALIWIHSPKKHDDAISARKRFAFEEVFFIQLEKQRDRATYQKEHAYKIEPEEKTMQDFLDRFPFLPTDAQKKTIRTILSDFQKEYPMSRLLEGDVGSGKTLVAAATAYAVAKTRPNKQTFGTLQVAYMVPTEILATQQFESFIQYFTHTGMQIGLITGNGCRKFPSKIPKANGTAGWTNISRTQLLKWVANGEITLLVGTHALIQKSVKFKHLAYVIIDEQHRFGTRQRASLAQKNLDHTNALPHLLSMTATPIPRTLALTIYGDLDLSLLDEMPSGRKPIITEIVLPNGRDVVYEKIKEKLKEGRQLYVICPRIDEPDPTKELALNAKSVKKEAERLERDVFKEYKIDILHSKMRPAEKDAVMLRFKEKKIDILVATSVVEVGVNVPNATVIVIEGGERFGLAQLHQLRGRVMRSSHQAFCYVFADSKTPQTVERLKALATAKNGFELAEYDLKFRGGGQLSGLKQWGVSDIAMEALKNIKMVEIARQEAQHLVAEDATLASYPTLLKHLSSKETKIHFE